MDRFKSAKKASLLGIFGNVFLCIIKGIVGFITNSQAMMADFFNSLGDIISSLMTFIGNKIASKPYDDDHNLGHGKAEYIYSLLISIIMIVMGLTVLKSSIVSLLFKSSYSFSIWLVVVCIVTIFVKFCLYLYTNKISKIHNNLLVKANATDHLNDCLVTFLNLISVILGYFNFYFFDGLVGVIISIWIFYSGVKIFKESYDVLIDKAMDDDIKDKVYNIIKKYHDIKKVNHFNSTPVGYKYQISLSIFVDGSMSTYDSHEIADNLEEEIIKEIEEIYLAVIHVNPI